MNRLSQLDKIIEAECKRVAERKAEKRAQVSEDRAREELTRMSNQLDRNNESSGLMGD